MKNLAVDARLRHLRDDVARLRPGDNARLLVLRNRFESILGALSVNDVDRFLRQERAIEFHAKLAFDSVVAAAKWQSACEEFLAIIDGVLEHLEISAKAAPDNIPAIADRKRVFLVHGHGTDFLNAVRAYLAHLGLEPIVLADEPNEGMTIFEKFERYSNVGFAVVLLSPDDVGRSVLEVAGTERYRARQNVVLELGYFMCRPGRRSTVALVDVSSGKELEKPSDISGILYIEYRRDDESWKRRLHGELRLAGADIRSDRY